MPKPNSDNVQIIRRYVFFLKNARRLGDQSVSAALKAINRFETHNGFRPFKSFHTEQAESFRRALDRQPNAVTGKPLSRSTVCSTLETLVAFFKWLADQPGYRKRITYSKAEYFNPSRKDLAIAKAVREPASPSVEQVKMVLNALPDGTAIEKRDRALIALVLATAARVTALTSLKVKHVDLAAGKLIQDARGGANRTETTVASPMTATTTTAAHVQIGSARDCPASATTGHLTGLS